MSQISASILIDILIKYILIKKNMKKRVYSHFLCLHGNSSSTASDRERRFRPSPCQGAVRRRHRIRSKFYFLKNLLCAFNSIQPMKNSYFPLRYKLSRVVLGAQEALLRNSWFATTSQGGPVGRSTQ